MLDFLNHIGFPGVMALLGCWLILDGIVGRFVHIKDWVTDDTTLRPYQRVLIAVLGGVLIGPGMYALYNGSAARLVAPSSQEYVAPAGAGSRTTLDVNRPFLGARDAALRRIESHSARLVLADASVPLVPAQRASNQVESFGLSARSLRRLRYQAFRGQVYIYVGEVSSPRWGSTEVFLFSAEAGATADGRIDDPTFQRLWAAATQLKLRQSIHNQGDSFVFGWGGAQYRLTVSRIYKVLAGSDQIVVDIYEV